MLSGVSRVTLEGEKVTPTWFKSLPRTREFRTLIVKNADLTVECIDELVEAEGLAALEIKYCKFGDREAMKLIVMNRLESLRVMGGQISDRIKDQIRLALPNAEVDIRRGAFLGVSCIAHPLGVEIVRVEPGTSAEQSGFKPQDVIVSFNSQPVQSFEDLTSLISQYQSGRKVPIVIARNANINGSQVEIAADKKWLLEGKAHVLGVEITSVGEGGLGDAAGLKVKDVIASINEQRLNKIEDLPSEGIATIAFLRQQPEVFQRDVELGRDARD